MYLISKIKLLNGFEAMKNLMICKRNSMKFIFEDLLFYFRASTQPNQVNYQTICDLYAEVVGVLAQSRYVIHVEMSKVVPGLEMCGTGTGTKRKA
jgi:hypothetical protein